MPLFFRYQKLWKLKLRRHKAVRLQGTNKSKRNNKYNLRVLEEKFESIRMGAPTRITTVPIIDGMPTNFMGMARGEAVGTGAEIHSTPITRIGKETQTNAAAAVIPHLVEQTVEEGTESMDRLPTWLILDLMHFFGKLNYI